MRWGRLDSKSTADKSIEDRARTRSGHVPTTRLLCCLSCSHCSGGQRKQRMVRKWVESAVKDRELLIEAERRAQPNECAEIDPGRMW